MATEQLVYFTRMTHTQLPDFGNETLIPFLCQFPLDGFLFVVVCFDHACKCFCSDLCLFREHELHGTLYSGVWFPPDWVISIELRTWFPILRVFL